MKITKYGTIKGGMCDKAHEARATRHRGAQHLLNKMVNEKCFVSKGGWYRVVKSVDTSWRKVAKWGNGPFQIGVFRFQQDVIDQLLETQKPFRWKWIERWAADISSFEFGAKMDSPLSIINPDEKCEFGYAKPHRDSIYQAKKQDGLYGNLGA